MCFQVNCSSPTPPLLPSPQLLLSRIHSIRLLVPLYQWDLLEEIIPYSYIWSVESPLWTSGYSFVFHIHPTPPPGRIWHKVILFWVSQIESWLMHGSHKRNPISCRDSLFWAILRCQAMNSALPSSSCQGGRPLGTRWRLSFVFTNATF